VNNSERAAFEDQIRQLFAGYNVPATQERIEAYWRGLQRMQLATVTRVVDHALGEDGPERLPTAPQLWGLYRDLRASSAPAAQASREDGPACDEAGIVGNAALLRCIVQHYHDGKPTIPAALVRKDGPLVAAKNQLVDAFRRLPEDERSPNELRDLIAGAFERIVQAPRERAA
jgi:hypothetical protein